MVNVEQNSGFGCDAPTLFTGGVSIEAINGKQFNYPRNDIWTPLQCYRDMYRGSLANSACQQADRTYREYNANARAGVGIPGAGGIYMYGEGGTNYAPGESMQTGVNLDCKLKLGQLVLIRKHWPFKS